MTLAYLIGLLIVSDILQLAMFIYIITRLKKKGD